MPVPDHLRAFVLPTVPATPLELDGFDLYLPAVADDPVPLVVLVHGGPMREAPEQPPRQWPVFRGYASALVERQVAVAMFDHAVLRSLDYAGAQARLQQVMEAARAHPSVDADRVGGWYFSGGGPLSAALLADPPPWLRLVALSYPMLEPFGDVAGFRPAHVLDAVGPLPVVLTRAGQDHPALLGAQAAFVAAAVENGVDLTVVEVPDGHHAFDVVDDTDQSRQALVQALDLVRERLG